MVTTAMMILSCVGCAPLCAFMQDAPGNSPLVSVAVPRRLPWHPGVHVPIRSAPDGVEPRTGTRRDHGERTREVNPRGVAPRIVCRAASRPNSARSTFMTCSRVIHTTSIRRGLHSGTGARSRPLSGGRREGWTGWVTSLRMLTLLVLVPILTGGAGAAGSAPSAEVRPVGVWPLAPVPDVTRRFDPPAVDWGAGHRGVDLLGATGQTVRAALAGTITFAGPLAGKQVVVVSHGLTRTTYEPVLPSVAVGAEVAAGAAIGTLAGAPSHCVPHACLHWGWRRGEEYLDPLGLVEQPRIRLLPPAGPAVAAEAGPSGLAAARSAGQGLGRLLGSGAGVSLAVGRAEPFTAHVGVELGGGQ